MVIGPEAGSFAGLLVNRFGAFEEPFFHSDRQIQQSKNGE